MLAPRCKLCGETHWSPVCPKFSPAKAERRVKEIETTMKPAAKPKAKAKRAKRGVYARRKGKAG